MKKLQVRTDSFRVAWPFQRASDRVAITCDEQSECACTCPRKDKKLLWANHSDRRFDNEWGGLKSLRNGEDLEHRQSLQIKHAVMRLICDA